MSYVVGEVTYVELFKDAEGKSRVSAVGNNLQRFKVPQQFYFCIILVPVIWKVSFIFFFTPMLFQT